MDLSKLKGVLPDNVINELDIVVNKFGVNTPLRMAHFLSQCSHESGGFKFSSENLNYSSKGLMTVFPKYFNTTSLAESYARKPEMIASRVYGGRMGNGSESTKDGYKFRGRGYIQLTGKDNYSRFDSFVDDDILSNPDLVASKYPLSSAAWFFMTNKINEVADSGSSDDVIKNVTKKVNGGLIGIDDRIKKFKEFHKLLS